MRLRDERPSMDPGMCFICEKADDCRYVDTLKNFEPMFFSPLIGRKFVCENCIKQMAKLIGFGENTKLRKDLEQAQTRIQVLEANEAVIRDLYTIG
jgi:hypothetical protein